MNRKKKDILIIEDDGGEALLCKEALEGNGYNTKVAHNGKDALDLIRGGPFDVILVDHALPDMTGLEFYEQIKKSSPRQLCIMVTGSGDERTAVEAIQSGMYDYIVKAANAAHLSTLPYVIEKSLERYKTRMSQESLREELADRTKKLEDLNMELIREINRRKQVENMLRQSEKILRKNIAKIGKASGMVMVRKSRVLELERRVRELEAKIKGRGAKVK